MPFFEQNVQGFPVSGQPWEENYDYASNDLFFSDFQPEPAHQESVENATSLKRPNFVLGENPAEQPDLKRPKVDLQTEYENALDFANLTVPQIVENIENALAIGTESLVNMLKASPQYLSYAVDIPTLQNLIIQNCNIGISGQTILWQLAAAKYWGVVEALLQDEMPLELGKSSFSYAEMFAPSSLFGLAVADKRWDIASMMLKAPYKPYIGPVFVLKPHPREVMPVVDAIFSEQWDFIKKLLAYHRHALNIDDVEEYITNQNGFPESATKKIFKAKESYPVSTSLVSAAYADCLGNLDEIQYKKILDKITESSTHLHLGNYRVDTVNYIDEYNGDISEPFDIICKRFNVDSFFPQEILGRAFQIVCEDFDLWSENIEVGKEIFYRAVFRKIRVLTFKPEWFSTIRELVKISESQDKNRWKQIMLQNEKIWVLDNEMKGVLKPVFRHIAKTQDVMQETFQALFI